MAHAMDVRRRDGDVCAARAVFDRNPGRRGVSRRSRVFPAPHCLERAHSHRATGVGHADAVSGSASHTSGDGNDCVSGAGIGHKQPRRLARNAPASGRLDERNAAVAALRKRQGRPLLGLQPSRGMHGRFQCRRRIDGERLGSPGRPGAAEDPGPGGILEAADDLPQVVCAPARVEEHLVAEAVEGEHAVVERAGSPDHDDRDLAA